MDRTKCLLAKGYLPSQLPPCFTTQSLGEHQAELYAEWLALQASAKNGFKIPKAPCSKVELFSVARVGHKRRDGGYEGVIFGEEFDIIDRQAKDDDGDKVEPVARDCR